MPRDGDSYLQFARRLADELVNRGVTRSESVANAIATVPRHVFYETLYLRSGTQSWTHHHLSYQRKSDFELVYRDEPLVVQTREGLPSIVGTMPSVIVEMLETLDLRPGDRVLELGTGTGYSTGLIAALVGDPGLVTTIEIDGWAAQTAKHNLEAIGMGDVSVIHESAVNGYPANAPYDRVLANFSVRFVPSAWFHQIRDGGKLVTPRADINSQHLLSLTRFGAFLEGRVFRPAAFPEMSEEEHQPVQVTSMPWPKVEPVGGPPLSINHLQSQALSSLNDPDYRLFHSLERPDHYLIDLTLGESMDPADFRPSIVDLVRGDVTVGPMYEDAQTGTFGSFSLLNALVETHVDWVQLGCPRVSDYVLAATRGHASHTNCNRGTARYRKWTLLANQEDSLDWEVRLFS